MEHIEMIQKCPLFTGIDINHLKTMLTCLGARVVRAGKGRTIFNEGDSADRIGVVLQGSVQILRDDYYGDRSILAHITQQDIFGEAYAFSDSDTLPVSAIASEDSWILIIDSIRVRSCCSNACDHHNQLIYNLLKLVSDKNLKLHQKIHITSRRTTRDKLMAYLTNFAIQSGRNEFSIPYDRQGLADYLQVDRSGLSAEIGKLRREGVIECSRDRFKLL